MKTRNTPGFVAAVAAALLLARTTALAVCPAVEIVSGLEHPLGVAISNQGNLIIAETSIGIPNTGRISIVDPSGNRRALVGGLPSGINDVLEPSGPAGVFMRGRTLYIAIGVGDVAIPGPFPGTALPNPNPLSSPLFSSVLAIHFSAAVEKNTEGFTLTPADHQALAGGAKITLTNGAGEAISVELVADFLNYTPNPLPGAPMNVRLSNPFDLVAIEDRLFVTDGGQNVVRQIDLTTGAQSILAAFPPTPNAFFPAIGGPVSDAVPTGIRESEGMLLVTLLRGVPFAPGTSQVVALDPQTGTFATFIPGLKTAIDVLPLPFAQGGLEYLVLLHSSSGLFFGSPGHLLGFDAAGGSMTILADCLNRPTSMALDARTGILYVTQFGGNVLAIPMAP